MSDNGEKLKSVATRWCITINSADNDPEGLDLGRSITDVEELVRGGDLLYAIGSWERGDNDGRLHLQCWAIAKSPHRAAWLGARIYRAYCEGQWAKQDDVACKYACDPKKPSFIEKAFEFGTRPSAGQGRRSDLKAVNESIETGQLTSFREVNDFNPAVAANNAQWVNWRLEEAAREASEGVQRYSDDFAPYVWQHWLYRYLTECEPAERKVIFVVDHRGHSGKTRFISEFRRNSIKKCQLMRPARSTDMAAALDVTNDILFLDIPRSKEEYVSHVYTFVEEIKDGQVFCPKFHSRMKFLRPCHVVIFMNFEVAVGADGGTKYEFSSDKYAAPHDRQAWRGVMKPDLPLLTHDRYAIWEMTENHRAVWNPRNLKWSTSFPPFKSYDEDMRPEPYVPPLKENSGPSFNGDLAGDGPGYWDIFERESRKRPAVTVEPAPSQENTIVRDVGVPVGCNDRAARFKFPRECSSKAEYEEMMYGGYEGINHRIHKSFFRHVREQIKNPKKVVQDFKYMVLEELKKTVKRVD